MQVRGRDSTAYYSCDDHFVVVDKNVDYGIGGSASTKNYNFTKLDLRNRTQSPVASSPFFSSGIFIFPLKCLPVTIAEVVELLITTNQFKLL